MFRFSKFNAVALTCLMILSANITFAQSENSESDEKNSSFVVQAEKVSALTGRPILAVAGSNT